MMFSYFSFNECKNMTFFFKQKTFFYTCPIDAGTRHRKVSHNHFGQQANAIP